MTSSAVASFNMSSYKGESISKKCDCFLIFNSLGQVVLETKMEPYKVPGKIVMSSLLMEKSFYFVIQL